MTEKPSISTALLETADISARRRRRAASPPDLDPMAVVREAIVPALRAGRLAIFAGAGVSYASGFPSWSQLIARLAALVVAPEQQAAFQLLSEHGSPLVMARFLRHQMGVNALFAQRVHQALYGPDVDYERDNATLGFVVELIAAAAAANAPISVFTYNFDDLVQAALTRRDAAIAFDTLVDEAGAHRAGARVRIHHVHGYLPRAPEGAPEDWPEPILAETGFNTLMSDPSAWANQVQARALAYDHCLFVGLSMADPNLRRLLDIARPSAPGRTVRRHVLATGYREGSRLAPGAPPMDAATADHLNRIEDEIAVSLGAVRVRLPDHAFFGELIRALPG